MPNAKCQMENSPSLPNKILRRELHLLLRRLGDQRQPDVRLALNISRNVAANVRARSVAQVCQIAAEIIDARSRPPEADCLSVLVKLLARIKIVGLKQGLCA